MSKNREAHKIHHGIKTYIYKEDSVKRETAKLMKMEKLDMSLIKKITGLPEEEIEKL
mgnify:CR=1 FL=1